MPTLAKPPKKKKYPNHKSENSTLRDTIYHSMKWRNLRNSYIKKHPLCEICLAKGKIVPAEDVHHNYSFQNYQGDEMIEAAYDPNNLVSLCKQCHAEMHKGNKRAYGEAKRLIEKLTKDK